MLGKVDELALEADKNIAIPFVLGETVKVIDGPFNGFDGTVEKINEEKENLKSWLKFLEERLHLELVICKLIKYKNVTNNKICVYCFQFKHKSLKFKNGKRTR